jgi:hypothetical protein
MLTYLSSYLAMASAFYFVIFEGVMSIVDPGFHDYFIPHSFDVSHTCTLMISMHCRGPLLQCNAAIERRTLSLISDPGSRDPRA